MTASASTRATVAPPKASSRVTTARWVLGGLLVLVAVPYLYNACTNLQVDLSVYRAGGATILDGGNLYKLLVPPVGLPFTYPPASAVLFASLARLPAHVVQFTWTLLSLVAAWGFARLSVAHSWNGAGAHSGTAATRTGAGDASTGTTGAGDAGMFSPMVLGVTLLAAVSDPGRVGISLGQINIFLALAVIADLSGALPRLPRGVLIGVAAALKLTPLFLVPYLVVTRRYRAAVTALTTFAVVSLAAAVVAPSDSVTYWLHGEFADAQRTGGIAYISNQSLNGVLIRALGGPDKAKVAWLVAAVVTGVAVLALCRSLFGARPWLADGAALVGMLLVSPVSWVHHWVFALPFVLGIWRLGLAWRRRPAAGPALLGCAGLLTVVLLSGAVWWVPHGRNLEYRADVWQFLLGNSQTLLALACLVAVASATMLPRAPSRPPDRLVDSGRISP